MEVFFLVALAAVAVWFFLKTNTDRGRRFVRAHLFLQGLEMGESVEEANRLAQLFGSPYLSPDSERRDIESARLHARSLYGGRQLSLIQAAKLKGFSG